LFIASFLKKEAINFNLFVALMKRKRKTNVYASFHRKRRQKTFVYCSKILWIDKKHLFIAPKYYRPEQKQKFSVKKPPDLKKKILYNPKYVS